MSSTNHGPAPCTPPRGSLCPSTRGHVPSIPPAAVSPSPALPPRSHPQNPRPRPPHLLSPYHHAPHPHHQNPSHSPLPANSSASPPLLKSSLCTTSSLRRITAPARRLASTARCTTLSTRLFCKKKMCGILRCWLSDEVRFWGDGCV